MASEPTNTPDPPERRESKGSFLRWAVRKASYLRAFAYRVAGREDASQSVFLRIVRRTGTALDRIRHRTAWAKQVILNSARNGFRKARREQPLSGVMEPSYREPVPEDD